MDSVVTFSAKSTPSPRASCRRDSLTSVITTYRAPTCRTTAAAISPIGPAPVISTSSPTSGNVNAVCTALPNGSKIAPRSGSSAGVVHPHVALWQHDVLGERPVAIDADARRCGCTGAAGRPGSCGRYRRRCGPRRTPGRPRGHHVPRRPRRPPRHRTRGRRSAARRQRAAAQSSHASMCRSVPQMPVRSTRIFTSPGPASGSGRSTSSSPGCAAGFVQRLHVLDPATPATWTA